MLSAEALSLVCPIHIYLSLYFERDALFFNGSVVVHFSSTLLNCFCRYLAEALHLCLQASICTGGKHDLELHSYDYDAGVDKFSEIIGNCY